MGKQSFNNAKTDLLVLSGKIALDGKIPPGNTGELLSSIEKNIEKEAPEVQWAMNFTTGWIGVYDAEYRSRCMAIGEKTGLYKDEKVAKGCTPSYLPDFIRMEAAKRNI